MKKKSFNDYLEIIKEEKVFKCPPETSDVALNLENRQKAIDEFGYGPLNPLEQNKNFWEDHVCNNVFI